LVDVNAAARRLLLVEGTETAGEQWLCRQLPEPGADDCLWVAARAPSGIEPTPPERVVQRLGGECRLLVFNAHQGFHPDAFAAAAGMLRGGGDCVVLAPPPAAWATYADPDLARIAAYPRTPADMANGFLLRLCALWQADDAVIRVTPDTALALRMAEPVPARLLLSDAQEDAIAAVMHVAQGHARRPLVLSADRGRGKSTVLGVAAAACSRPVSGASPLSRHTARAPRRCSRMRVVKRAWPMPRQRMSISVPAGCACACRRTSSMSVTRRDWSWSTRRRRYRARC